MGTLGGNACKPGKPWDTASHGRPRAKSFRPDSACPGFRCLQPTTGAPMPPTAGINAVSVLGAHLRPSGVGRPAGERRCRRGRSAVRPETRANQGVQFLGRRAVTGSEDLGLDWVDGRHDVLPIRGGAPGPRTHRSLDRNGSSAWSSGPDRARSGRARAVPSEGRSRTARRVPSAVVFVVRHHDSKVGGPSAIGRNRRAGQHS